MNEKLEDWVEGSIEIINKFEAIGKTKKWIKNKFRLKIKESTYYEISVIIGRNKEFLPYAEIFKTNLYLINYLTKKINNAKIYDDMFYSIKFLTKVISNKAELYPLAEAVDNRLKQPPSQYDLSLQIALLSTYLYLVLQVGSNVEVMFENFVRNGQLINYFNFSWNNIQREKDDEKSMEVLALCVISLLWVGTSKIPSSRIHQQYNNLTNYTYEHFWEKVLEKLQDLEMLPRLLSMFRRRNNSDLEDEIIYMIIRKYFENWESYYESLAKAILDTYILIEKAINKEYKLINILTEELINKGEELYKNLITFIKYCIKDKEILNNYILNVDFNPQDPDNLSFMCKVFEERLENKSIIKWVYDGFNKLSSSGWQKLLTSNGDLVHNIIIPLGKKYKKKFGKKLRVTIKKLIKKSEKKLENYSEYIDCALNDNEKRQIEKDLNEEFWRRLERERYYKMSKFLSYYGKYLSFKGKEDKFIRKIIKVFLLRKNINHDEIKWILEMLQKEPFILKKAKKASVRTFKNNIKRALNKKNIDEEIKQTLEKILNLIKQ